MPLHAGHSVAFGLLTLCLIVACTDHRPSRGSSSIEVEADSAPMVDQVDQNTVEDSVFVQPKEPPADPTFLVIDSLGMRVVRNLRPAWAGGEEWTVGPEVILTIGLADGPPEYLFEGIRGVFSGSGGSIGVVDNGSRQIRFFDAEGRHLKTAGGNGDGPGEFRNPSYLGSIGGDSVAVWDRRRQVLTVLDRGGGYVRSENIRDPDGLTRPIPYGILEGGKLVAIFPEPMPGTPVDGTEFSDSFRVWVLDLESGKKTLAIETEGARWRMFEGLPGAVPFSSTPGIGTHRQRVFVSPPNEPMIRVFDDQGVEIGRWEIPQPRLRVLRGEMDAFRESSLGRLKGARQAWERRRWAVLEPVEFRPFYDRIVTDSDRSIWARLYYSPGDPVRTWHILSTEGEFLGPIEVPDDFSLQMILSDRVLGVTTDDLGVERIVAFPLSRGE